MRIRNGVVPLGLLVLAIAPCAAGEVYGKVFLGTESVGDAASVAATCGETSYPAVRTDASGSYHLMVKETGKCTLSVTYSEETATLAMSSYDEGVQYDVVLERKDGKLTARRK
jgi:hypothetical protein